MNSSERVLGLNINGVYAGASGYADDIVLLSPSLR